MPAITKEDFSSHLYEDIINEITRGNNTLAERALKSALGEAKAYLRRYDLAKLFSADVEDENLTSKVIDMASWHLVKLANPNVNLELFKSLYDDAISFFEKIMKGQLDPDGWPYKSDDPATPEDESASSFGIGWSSNKKRNNHF